MDFRELNEEEKRVIEEKGTERPFTGEYVDHRGEGIYTCKKCGLGLYRPDNKFDSHCGWPSFDDYIEGTVKKQRDADGRRTEIVCARCGAHLGHVFHGEGYTPKDTRHCVNSISLQFVADQDIAKAVFGGGCFWGVESSFQKMPGVVATTVGYAGGDKKNPTYKEVCAGGTGHIESVEVEYDPSLLTYEKLLKYFFEIHDPAQYGRQGPDVGHQYQSAIFYQDEEQQRVSREEIDKLKEQGVDVATVLLEGDTFWPAEDYHQDYYIKKGIAPTCNTGL